MYFPVSLRNLFKSGIFYALSNNLHEKMFMVMQTF